MCAWLKGGVTDLFKIIGALCYYFYYGIIFCPLMFFLH